MIKVHPINSRNAQRLIRISLTIGFAALSHEENETELAIHELERCNRELGEMIRVIKKRVKPAK